ncbi:MAG: tyrosine--tRNA ligase [Thermoplasmata archaeon]
MNTEERMELVMNNVQEVVTEEELRDLLKRNSNPSAYIGIEPSGMMHVGQGMMCANKVKDMQEAGFHVKILLADWHAYINDKLGGDIEAIRVCGEYIKDCFLALGVDPDRTEFVLATDMMDRITYWERVLRVAKANSVARIKRAVDIMGRDSQETEADSSMLIYPSLQVTDIFELNVDVAYAGMDQRRAHMLARDTADKLGWKKPVALHTPILSGLKGTGRMDAANKGKMSKSDPDSCIFIHDDPKDISRKINGAYCPPEVEGNPILEMAKYIVFTSTDELHITRPEKWGGDLHYESYEELEKSYLNEKLHPADLKSGVANALSNLLKPVRDYFKEKPDNHEKVKNILESLR